MNRSNQLKGLLLTAIGVLVLTPDALLVRLIRCDPWTLLFWRGLLQFSALFLFYLITRGASVLRLFRSIGLPGLIISCSYAAGNILFVHSIRTTTVANTLLIISIAPLISAVMSRILIQEKTERRTWIATTACLAGVAVIFQGGLSGGHLRGNLSALTAACFMATSFVLIRKHRATPMIPAVAVSGILMSAAVWPWSLPGSVQPQDMRYLFILGFIVMPIAFGLITLGPRYISAPEVGLLMLIETLLGPVWVWLVLHEHPAPSTFLGGAIVLSALAAHALAGLRSSPGGREPPASKPGH